MVLILISNYEKNMRIFTGLKEVLLHGFHMFIEQELFEYLRLEFITVKMYRDKSYLHNPASVVVDAKRKKRATE
jgi:hypothetical protein